MLRNWLDKFAITLSFFFGVLAITGILYVVNTFLMPDSPAQGMNFWVDTALTGASIAALCGAFVDSLRLATSVFLKKKLPYRIKLHKILNHHLA